MMMMMIVIIIISMLMMTMMMNMHIHVMMMMLMMMMMMLLLLLMMMMMRTTTTTTTTTTTLVVVVVMMMIAHINVLIRILAPISRATWQSIYYNCLVGCRPDTSYVILSQSHLSLSLICIYVGRVIPILPSAVIYVSRYV